MVVLFPKGCNFRVEICFELVAEAVAVALLTDIDVIAPGVGKPNLKEAAGYGPDPLIKLA